METSTIKCPSCGKDIEISDALKQQVRKELSEGIEKQYAKREKALDERADSVSQQEKKIDELVKTKVKAIEDSALETAKLSVNDELTKLKSSEEQLKRTLKESNEREMALLNKEQVLNEKVENAELEIARQVSIKTTEIKNASDQKVSMKEQESKLLIEGLTNKVEDLQKKLSQGSQQVQGEILEEELTSILRRTFPMDVIEEIAKGVKGADVLQRVNNSIGEQIGSILWESKYTKVFKATWLPKIKGDMLDGKADLGVILSMILPDEIKHVGEIDGVWICDYHSIVGIGKILRSQLLAVASQKRNEKNKGDKANLLYDYFISNEFRQRIELIVQPFIQMQNGIAQEKRAMAKIWKTREKQVESIIENLSMFTGDISGITGKNLELPAFELGGELGIESVVESE